MSSNLQANCYLSNRGAGVDCGCDEHGVAAAAGGGCESWRDGGCVLGSHHLCKRTFASDVVVVNDLGELDSEVVEGLEDDQLDAVADSIPASGASEARCCVFSDRIVAWSTTF